MKSILLPILLLTSIITFGQSSSKKEITKERSTQTGWPSDVEGLVKHLNSWMVDELDAYERPEEYPNFVTSGETNGWIAEHKRLLKELGTTVKWNADLKKYELQ